MPQLLQAPRFRDPAKSRIALRAASSGFSSSVQQHIESLVAASPDPDSAARYLNQFRQQHPDALKAIVESSGMLQRLIAVFGFSRFLAEELLQHPEWIADLRDPHRLRSAEEYGREIAAFLAAQPANTPDSLLLARFRRRQMLRILIRDVLGFATLAETTEELSNLADSILESAYQRIRASLVSRHGAPLLIEAGGTSSRECGFAVIALGKLGGIELNYSSDIDLMFLYEDNGETAGPERISNKQFYKKIANELTSLLSTYTAEGMCYRVDLRLRPDGSLGEVCISLDGAKSYYEKRARDWELQMLIKARVAAGDRRTGQTLLDFVEPLIYSSTLDFSAVETVSVTRERIGEKLSRARAPQSGLNVKLARGGIRDIEFLAQCLQRLHGGAEPWVRHGGTLLALSRLSDKSLISGAEYGRLASAYQFLRHVEHRLQFEDDRQTHTLPTDAADLELLARKMPVSHLGSASSADLFRAELEAHLGAVREIYERVIHAQQPLYYGPPEPPLEPPAAFAPVAENPSSNVVRFLDQRAPGLAAAVNASALRRGARAFDHFLERLTPHPEYLAILDREPVTAARIFDIFEHSPYLSEQLIRTPELIQELSALDVARASGFTGAQSLEDGAALRRYFRREMFALLSASFCLPVPVFETLERTSELADASINAAYRMAVADVLAAHPPAASYVPGRQMMAIALGRLGMREFDLSSDADLIFVLPDEDKPEYEFWTRVASRIIDLITAYTGEGMLFVVDTRLRPNGASGALLQSESAYFDYFSRGAEAWEGIAYMKARAVAGDTDRATSFLTHLQELDWRRYGQHGDSRRDLRQMRLRIEKEQGNANPLKAGSGGYYDIDFLLMYLRLKGAGIFFKVLNTPERVDIIEKMGHLDRPDADFLREAATFYRAIDHALRVYSGHAEGSLPVSEMQLEALTELVRRWTPERVADRSLPSALDEIRPETRRVFDRLFS